MARIRPGLGPDRDRVIMILGLSAAFFDRLVIAHSRPIAHWLLCSVYEGGRLSVSSSFSALRFSLFFWSVGIVCFNKNPNNSSKLNGSVGSRLVCLVGPMRLGYPLKYHLVGETHERSTHELHAPFSHTASKYVCLVGITLDFHGGKLFSVCMLFLQGWQYCKCTPPWVYFACWGLAVFLGCLL